MATYSRFEDLEVWQNARLFNQKISKVVNLIKSKNNYSLSDQMSRSAGSCMDNIAEGFEREGNREFIQMLAIAKGSIGETRSQLYRAFDQKYISDIEFKELKTDCEGLSKSLAGFIGYLKNSTIKGKKFN